MQRMLTVILACLGMVGALAIDTYLPSMPDIGRTFAVGPLAVQQTLSVFLFTFAFMMLFYGTLSDSFGRRPVILVSLTVYTMAWPTTEPAPAASPCNARHASSTPKLGAKAAPAEASV